MKAATSLQVAQSYYDNGGVVLPIRGAADVVTDPCGASAAKIASETVSPRIMFWAWYAEANNEFANLTTAFALGEIETVDDLLDQVQAAFDRDRENPSVELHTWDEILMSGLAE
jgi:hypothetical protein